MKNTINISIQKPCSENFNNFEKTNLGGFCKSCAKEVIDFTNMSDKEISTFFKTKKENTCGQFYKDQLKTYQETRNKKELKKYHFMSALGFSIVSLFSSNTIIAQNNKPDSIQTEPSKVIKHDKKLTNFILKGTVSSSEDKYPLPGVSVVLKNNIVGTETDFDGNFKLKNIKEGDILSFYSLGYKTQEIRIKKQQETLKIIMKEDNSVLSEVITVGEVAIKNTYKTKRSLWQRIKSIF